MSQSAVSDGGDGAHGHRAAAPIGAAIEILPDVLDLLRIAADEAGDDVVGKVRGDGQLAAVEGGIAEAGEALVGLDLQGDEVAARTGDDDLGGTDFHVLSLAPSPQGLACALSVAAPCLPFDGGPTAVAVRRPPIRPGRLPSLSRRPVSRRCARKFSGFRPCKIGLTT